MRKKSKPELTGRRSRVLIVDRHTLMRRAAAKWINASPDLEVCGLAGGVTHAFCAVNQLQPDVVITEIMRLRDLDFIRELHRQHRRLPILVLSMQDEAVYGARVRAVGACGYVMKEAGGAELVRHVRAVLQEQSVAGRGIGQGDAPPPRGLPGVVQERAETGSGVG